MWAKIVMTLLSDTCIGAGNSISGIVDADVQFDATGLPYIPAKRLKGLLREEATELVLLKDQAYLLDYIFGLPGSHDGGALTLENGRLSKIESFKQYQEVTVSEISEAFTTTRTQTAIDPVMGVADENSLRVTRVIPKGYVFEFLLELSCTTDVQTQKSSVKDEAIKLLTDATKCIRHIGTNRTRGFGHVSCKLCYIESDSTNPENKNASTFHISDGQTRIEFELTTLSDCVLDVPYVRGSAVLGAAAAAYLRDEENVSRQNAHTDSKFAALFLEDHLCFGNAYPQVNNNRSVPIPLCLKEEKGEKRTLYNLYSSIDSTKQYAKPDYSFCHFGSYGSNYLIFPRINDTHHFHHKRDSDTAIGNAGTDGTFYDYSAISEGTVFRGFLRGETKYLEIVSGLLHNTKIHVGKSRSAQYGKCHISFCNPVSNEYEWDVDGGKIPLMLNSDTVILNDNGNPTLSLDSLISEIKANLSISYNPEKKVNIDNIFYSQEGTTIGTGISGGFNTQWRTPHASEPCFAMGSVIALDVSKLDDDILKDLPQKLENIALGKYTNRGYGEVCIAPIQNYDKFRPLRENQNIMVPEISSSSLAVDSILLKIMEKRVFALLRQNALNDKVSENYFVNICKILDAQVKKAKRPVQRLQAIVESSDNEATITNKLNEFISNERRAATVDKPYTEILECLKPDERYVWTNALKSILIRENAAVWCNYQDSLDQKDTKWFELYKHTMLAIIERIQQENRTKPKKEQSSGEVIV